MTNPELTRRSGAVTLTPRQIQIVKAAYEGKSIKMTALSLHISVKTVQNHRNKIIAKLGCYSIANAATQLARAGMM